MQHEPDFARVVPRQNFVFPHTVVKYLAQRAASQRHEDQKIATAGSAKKGRAPNAFGFVKIAM